MVLFPYLKLLNNLVIMGKKKKLSLMNLERYSYKEAFHDDVRVRCRILIVCEGEKQNPIISSRLISCNMEVWFMILSEGGKD